MLRSLRITVAAIAASALAMASWAQSQNAKPQTSPAPVNQEAKLGAQQPAVKKSPFLPYAGTWTAMLEGKPFLTVKLTLNGERLTGSVHHPHAIDLYDNGEVKSFSNDYSAGLLRAATFTGDGLLLTVQDGTTQELNRFSMQLTSDTTANFKMLAMSMPPGMPKPRPWKLTRTGAASNAPSKP